MDENGIIIVLLLAVIATPLIRYFVWRSRFNDIRDRLKKLETQSNWLRDTLHAVALQVEELKTVKPKKRKAAKKPAAVAVKAESIEELQPAVKSEPLSPIVSPAGTEAPPPLAPEPEPVPEPATPALEAFKVPAAPEPPRKMDAPVSKEASVLKPPGMLRTEAKRIGQGLGRLFKSRTDQTTDWETVVGRNWLNLVGIVVLVIGMVLLTQQTLLYLGPEGKIGTGVLAGLVLLAGGIGLGRWPKYQLLGWTLLGGGWALLYFTAYATYNVEQAKIVDSPVVALVCLFLVAAGIIAHSFTYKSQLLTALAYGLGFLSVTMSPVTIYSLVATLVLAASLVGVLRVLPWHHLVLVGVIGTYLNHWRWTAEASAIWATAEGPGTAITEGFWLSTVILAMYWLVFVVASFTRKPESPDARNIHFATNLVNTVGMLGLIAWQTWQYQHGQLYYLTAPASVAYACVAYFDRKFAQQLLFLFNSTVAVVLFAVTLPLVFMDIELAKDWLTLYWALGALIVLYAGAKLTEIVIRVEAYLLFALASLAAWQFNLGGEFLERSPMLWPIVPVVVVLLTAVDDWLQRVRGQAWISPIAAELSWAFAIVATVLLGRLMWNLVEPGEAGLTWLLVGLVLLEAGLATSRHLMRVQGYMLVAGGAFATLAINLNHYYIADSAGLPDLVLQNWQLCATAAAGLYYWAWRMFRSAGRLLQTENDFNFFATVAATALLSVLLYREVDWSALAAAWMALALLLFVIGWYAEEFHLRAQAYVLSFAALVTAVAYNIYELHPATAGYDIPHWVIAGCVTAGLASLYLSGTKNFNLKGKQVFEKSVTEGASYGATLLLVLILWKELPSVGVAVAWTVLSLALFEVSGRFGLDALRYQSHLLMIAVFGRVFMANFTIIDEAYGISHRLLSVAPIIATIYYLRLRILETLPVTPENNVAKFSSADHPLFVSRLYCYAAAILIVALMRFELGRAYAVLGWAAILLILYWLGRRQDEFDFRVQAYLLAILAFARSWATSVYLLGSFYGVPERMVTAVPVIMALLAATFMSPSQPVVETKPVNWAVYADVMSRKFFALLASILVPVLIFYQVSADYVSIGWAIAALVMLGTGFVAKERTFRLCGLALLMLTLGKVTIFDLAGVETIYRIFSFIVLGVILLLASLAYTRYRDTLERYV